MFDRKELLEITTSDWPHKLLHQAEMAALGGAPSPKKESASAKRARLQREAQEFKRQAVDYRNRGMKTEAVVALRKFKVGSNAVAWGCGLVIGPSLSVDL